MSMLIAIIKNTIYTVSMVDTRFSVSVHIVVSLAYRPEVLTNSDALAGVLKTNPTFIRKLVSKLVEAGIVQSFRGKGGGIRLARSPKEITLRDIYVAAMDDKALMSTPKKSAHRACKVSCSMTDILCEVSEGVELATKSYLAKTVVHDLLKKIS
jgi:Rrf2 family protein